MKKKAAIITYGCQMNVNDSAKIKKILEDLNYEITGDINDSDAVFLNTCTIREGAANKVYGRLGDLKRIKSKRKDMIIGLVGCLAQEKQEEIAKEMKHIDIVMGNQNIHKLAQAIEKIENGNAKHVILVDDEDALPPSIDAKFDSDITASISITYGCNNFCTYCIVPYVRGRERSVPLEEILKEVKKYVEKGYKEIYLLGQNVNSYGNDFDNEDNFAKLLTELCKVEGEFWIRFISPHPRDFTDDLIEVISKEEKITKSLHLPLQAGSSKTLKAMNRGYTKEAYIDLVERIRNKIEGIVLTTDIIVGFPGENEEDFLDTLDVVRKARYETAYMFMYSKRNKTPAAIMEQQVEEGLKKERLQRLIKLQNQISKEESQNYLGKTERILVEGKTKKNPKMMSGRTATNKIVIFKGEDNMKGTFLNINIVEAKTWTLYGEIQ